MKYLIGKIGGTWGVIGPTCDDKSVQLGGTVDAEIYDTLCSIPEAYYIDEQGIFHQNMTLDEAKSKLLAQKYIPDITASMIALLKSYLKSTPLQEVDEKLKVSGLYEEWELGSYSVGDIRNHGGQTWECWTAHDNAVYPDINPDNPQTWANFWRPLHGKSAETARPWTKPRTKPRAGTTDMYHAGEYMVYTDGKIYKCTQDTGYSPEEYAAAWAVVK